MREAIKHRQRISTLLGCVLVGTALIVVLGLLATSVRLVELQGELGKLEGSVLPRLVKLAQLSQEASATSSIAPALGMKPTAAEFDTLLSRIKDKERAQLLLIEELESLFPDDDGMAALRRNGDLLVANLRGLTDAVGEQISVTQRLDGLGEQFHRFHDLLGRGHKGELATALTRAVLLVGTTLLDPKRSRFSRNRRELEASMVVLGGALAAAAPTPDGQQGELAAAADAVVQLWASVRDRLFADKAAELANAFNIKALAEENSLIANRLLSSASNAFWAAQTQLEEQIEMVGGALRVSLGAIIVLLLAQAVGSVLAWRVLKRRVFERLGALREALRAYASDRRRDLVDDRPDEIGTIANAMRHYMTVIDQRETELAAKTGMLEQLSNQLAKYLSPQLYESISSGRQEVKVTSSRKKLTIFFSDIVGFTETADQLESEDLTQLLNQYLTEMSKIAVAHGATIDKYIGDGMLIFFGDPETRGVREDALACVQMAIAMRQRLRELAVTWRAAGIARPLQVRMGVHTGFCTVGNFGSEDRLDYTIVGGAVNIAARLEELAAAGEILVSFETFALIEHEVACAEIGSVEVKGIAHPIQTYRVVDEDRDGDEMSGACQ